MLLQDALYYEKYNEKLKCLLCPHQCVIGNKQYGRCSVRTNIDGVLQTINYGQVTAIANDPIEKKPLYHFKPGKNIVSVGTFGCNFDCDFCQNYSIAQYRAESNYISPDQLITKCSNLQNNAGIAFTYNEPSIWYEYVYETAKKVKTTNPHINIVLVTNGYIEKEPLEKLLPYIDAMNIDLKSFQNDYYTKICKGSLDPVLRTIEQSIKSCHVEITTLLVNGRNDSQEEVENLARYLGSLDNNIPLHLSRYFPTYKMNLPPTEIEVIIHRADIAKQYLNYVYIGNIAGIDNSTHCPECKTILVERSQFSTDIYMDTSICHQCGYDIEIIL